MIYIGENQISGIYLGDAEIFGIYAGDLQLYPMGEFQGLKLTPKSLSFASTGETKTIKVKSSAAWEIQPFTGDWLSFSQMSGEAGTFEIQATALPIEDEDRSLEIVFNTVDMEYSAVLSVEQILCAYFPCVEHIGNVVDGYSLAGAYLLPAGLTTITSCDFDMTGIKSITSRNDGKGTFWVEPAVALFISSSGTYYPASNSRETVTSIELDCPDLEKISYPFSVDGRIAPNLENITLTSTNKVTYLRQMFRGLTNLRYLKLGDLSNAKTSEGAHFSGCTNLEIVEFEEGAKLPKESMLVGSSYSGWYWNTCNKLTVQSLVNILTALPKLNDSTIYTSLQIQLGDTNLAKLSDEQIAIATNKGWRVTA